MTQTALVQDERAFVQNTGVFWNPPYYQKDIVHESDHQHLQMSKIDTYGWQGSQ